MNTILIVEDEDNLGFTLAEYLTSKGFSTHLAQSVSEARALFNEHHPNIILMDIGLPDGSGLDLAKELREQRKDFLLLFLSALNDPDTKLEGLEIGAEDYITKPFDTTILMARVRALLRRAENNIGHFTLITFWENLEVIKNFAGDDFEKAKYYSEDKNYLLEFEEEVIHYEVFAAPKPGKPFLAELQKSGKTIYVPEDQSLLEALEANGIEIPNMCRGGVCGQCASKVLDGEVEHRDNFLSEKEHSENNCIMPCVSRTKSSRLRLDI